MVDKRLVSRITEEVMRQLKERGYVILPEKEDPAPGTAEGPEDITSPSCKAKPLLRDPQDMEALLRMKRYTNARIGVGRAGPRLNTQTMLAMRADHAKARDSVFTDVSPELTERMGLMTVQTMCDCKDTYVTRPDLGRTLSGEAEKAIRSACVPNPDVQIFAADGLSSSAIEANLEKILPILMDGLQARGLKVGTPFYLRFGRVAAEDQVSEVLGARVVCVLIGERPGLATAESMSAYIAYNAYVGMPEAKRTVVSNIHKDGLSAVEAGAYIVEVIAQILEQKASGVDLVK
ncbi:ethanolamine ammonia-lyase subunit EutC [Pseudoflavonifractor sp. HCP28S3_F10]|uniref:ethanolamine ammonia-lyase subunit EutC n=1 Tax=Pseudoflavonifractor sp. HCP28S3_F10 TaxID=3438947 RepID=UPI003F8CC0B1